MVIETSSNFREIAIGKIVPGVLYRSNHPICNNKQVKEIVLAAQNAGIKTIINLSDNISSLQSNIAYCPWYKKMFDENKVIALNVSMRFKIMDKMFLQKIKDAITFMIDHEPPYLIHCVAGIDRTGFYSILLESFMGASFNEMVKDYMLSFVDKTEYSENDYKNGSLFMTNIFTKIKGGLFNQNDNPRLLAVKYLKEKVKVNDCLLLSLEKKLEGCNDF